MNEKIKPDSVQKQDNLKKYLTYDLLLGLMLEGCQIIGFDWRYLYLNDAAVKQSCRPREKTLGFTMMECYPGIENTEMFAKLRQCMEKRIPRRMENEFVYPDGRRRWFELSMEPVPEGVLVFSWDITERKEAETRPRQNERRYRLIAENTADVVWTVDLQMRPTYISPSIKRLLGYSVEEAMNKKMEEIFTPSSYEVATKALAEEMTKEKDEKVKPRRSRILGFELVRKDGTTVPVEIKYSGIRDEQGRPVELLAVVRDISERKRLEQEKEKSAEAQINALEKTVQAISMIAEMRDPYTAGHQKRVTQLACAIAEKLNFERERITALRLASLIHDIGKVRVPAEILTNPDGLSEAEFTIIKTHPVVGYEILKSMELSLPVAQIVYQHHERLDGSGYPQGLRGDEIIMEARILGVADVVEAMASHRPYRPALGIDKALEEISAKKDILYDAKIVDTCVQLFNRQEFKFG